MTKMIQTSFFTKEHYEQAKCKPLPRRSGTDQPLCEECKLHATAKSPMMKYSGEGKKKTLIIAEQPAEDEDDAGTQLVGKTGKFYRGHLEELGYDLDRDFWKINAVNCYGGSVEKKATPHQLKCCRPFVQRTISDLNPKCIFLLGEKAIQSHMLDKPHGHSVGLWRGFRVPDRDLNSWLFPQFHPAYPMREEHNARDGRSLMSVFKRDLRNALEQMESLPSVSEFTRDLVGEADKIELITDFTGIMSFLLNILETAEAISFDYETNCLKPYWGQSKILTCAISTSPDKAHAFPLFYPTSMSKKEVDLIKRRLGLIMQNEYIRKRAHNLKFEDQWTTHSLGYKVNNWERCSMVTAHIIDDRDNITGLKFQAYLHFGTPEYDAFVKDKIKPKGNSYYNRLHEVPLRELLLYNGIDALLEERLYYVQEKEIARRGLESAVAFFHEGILSMSSLQDVGIPVDQAHYKKEDEELAIKIDQISKDIETSEEATKYYRATGKVLKPSSNDALRKLYIDILEVEATKETKAGKESMDESSLKKIGGAFGQKIIQYRSLDKLRSTYLRPMLEEAYMSKIHPFFDLHTVRTYRSSSSQPNFQNIPRQDLEALRITRGGIKASPGNQLLEIDFGAMEVRIATCYSKDEMLIKYNSTPGADMHRDQAMALFHIDKQEVTKDLRFFAKNEWVFAQLYGSYAKACAMDLWGSVILSHRKTVSGVDLQTHMINLGIIRDASNLSMSRFIEHCEKVEKDFWQMFKQHKDWQIKTIQDYIEKGYVELFLGFKRGGFLQINKIINTPIQGTAFHCLLWTLGQVLKVAKKEGWKSRLIAQIHDSMLIDLYPSEAQHVLTTIKRIATKDIREEFDWICVPLLIEAEMCQIDSSWDKKYQIDEQGYAMIGGNRTRMTSEAVNW